MSYDGASAAVDAAWVEAAQRGFGVRASLCGVRHGYRSSVAELEGPAGRFVMKAVPASGLGALEGASRAAVVLGGHGFPVARPVPVLGGSRYALVDGPLAVSLSEFVAGTPFDADCLEQWSSAGRTLAHLHRLPAGDLPPVGRRFTCGPALDEVERDLLRLEAGCAPAELVRRLRTGVERARRAAEALAVGDTMTHGDYRGQNVVMAGTAVRAVLDLDSFASGDPLLDLSYSVVFFQAVLRDGPPTSGQASSFLAGYESVYGRGDRDGLQGHLLTALLRGLTLWCVIRYLHPGRAPRARLDAWIGSYLPLADGPEPILG